MNLSKVMETRFKGRGGLQRRQKSKAHPRIEKAEEAAEKKKPPPL